MAYTPERIWANWTAADETDPPISFLCHTEQSRHAYFGRRVDYIRADIQADELAAAKAEVARLRDALVDVVMCNHHSFDNGPTPKWVNIARNALAGYDAFPSGGKLGGSDDTPSA